MRKSWDSLGSVKGVFAQELMHRQFFSIEICATSFPINFR